MMNRVLGSHSQVLGTRELHYFGDVCKMEQLNKQLSDSELLQMAAMLIARFERGLWKSQVGESDRQAAREVVDKLPENRRSGAQLFEFVTTTYAKKENKTFICEQTPRNIFYIRQLLEAFPQSKFIHMVRDPRAVMASQKNRWRQRSMGRKVIPWSETLRVKVNYHPWTICKLWSKATNMAIDMKDHPNVYLQKFEDIVSEPEEQTREICQFLDIEFEPPMLNIPQMGSSHKVNEAKAGITKDVVSKWSDSLDLGEIASCERLTSPLMDKFDYPQQITESRKNTGYVVQLLTYPLHVVGMMLANPRRVWIQLSALLGVR